MAKKLALVGGNLSFDSFLGNAFSGEIIRFQTMEEAGSAAIREPYEAIIIPAEPGKIHEPLSLDGLKTYTALWNRGQKVYLEMYDLQDAFLSNLFGIRIYGSERCVFKESFVWKDTLLQARCASYQPAAISGGKVILKAESCIGSHTPVIPGKDSSPVIVSNKGFYYSTMRLSEFDRFTMLPNADWKDLFSEIFAVLLGEEKKQIEKSFEKKWPAIKLAGEANTVSEAIRRAVNWHFESGVMPDKSGAQGCYEMLRSGNFNVKCLQRTDVMLLTAALLCSAGKAMGECSWQQFGTNLADHCLNEELQIRQGHNRGLFHWFDTFGGELERQSCYASDNGRDGMAMLQLYRVTGDRKYLESAKLLGDAYLRWADGDAYLKNTFFLLNQSDLNSLKRSETPCNSPVFYDGMAIVLSNLYRFTHEEKYKIQLKRTADTMADDYPHYATNFTPLTKNFIYSRLIVVLCAAQEIGCGDYSSVINGILHDFEELQDVSGGVRDAGLVMTDNTYTHEEFAVSMGKEYDNIMDLLYCANNLLGCFSTIRNMKNPLGIHYETAEKMRKKMVSLLLRIQIAENDPRLNGGWMRAYDMQTGEYYGVNKDLAWGPYCIMGGWIMGIIPLLLLEDSGIPSLYSIE